MDSNVATTKLYALALRTVTEHRLLQAGDRVAVGVSGGADSVALLAFLCALRQVLPLTLLVCHVDHGLRGAESEGDAAFVEALAERLELPYHSCRLQVAEEAAAAGLGVEEYARNRRYAFFAEVAGPDGRVATAHTLSDAVETVVFNLVRGTGVKGLCGIPRCRGQIVRPLRDCTREQVEQFLQTLGQPWREDSTNSSDRYSRNFIRHNLIPAMERLNPALHQSVARTMTQMEQQWAMTQVLADAARAQVVLGDSTYDRHGLLSLPQPVASLLLQEWLEQSGGSTGSRLLELMLETAERGSGAVELASGVRFVAEQDYLRLLCESPAPPPFYRAVQLPLSHGERTVVAICEGKSLQITRFTKKNAESAEKFYNKDLKSMVDCDKIKEPVFVHEPRKADTIHLQGRTHSIVSRYRTGSRGFGSSQILRMAVVEDIFGTVWAERLGRDGQRGDVGAAREVYLFEVLEDKVQ